MHVVLTLALTSIIAATLLTSPTASAEAQSPLAIREMQVDSILLERISLRKAFSTVFIDKICLDGHAYFLTQDSLTPTYKDGQIETCKSAAATAPNTGFNARKYPQL